jgi:hypothetical protein
MPTAPTHTVAVGAAAVATALTIANPALAGKKDEKAGSTAGERSINVTEQVPADVLDRADCRAEAQSLEKAMCQNPGHGESPKETIELPPLSLDSPEQNAGEYKLGAPLGSCEQNYILLTDPDLIPSVLMVCNALELSPRGAGPGSNR